MISTEEGILQAGVGPFQRRLFLIFGLVWAADAMQVLAIGFSAPSIAKTFDISIAQALQSGTMFFVGMLVGAAVFGRLADRFGRRPILVTTVIIDAVFGIASAYSPSFELLLAFRLLTGLGVGGTLPVDYAMMAEFLPTDRRGRWLVWMESFWAVGTVALAFVSLLAGSQGGEAWRTIFFVTSIPALVGLLVRLYVPESPLYLSRRGQTTRAREVLQFMATANGHNVRIGELRPEFPCRNRGTALFSMKLRRRSILLMSTWFAVSLSYYGVFVYLPIRFASEGLGFMRGQYFLILVALVQIPGYALAAHGVEKWGRKPTLIGFLTLSSIGCVVYGAGQSVILIVGVTLLMSFALLGTWAAMYAFTPEVYPTHLRASGMGAAGAAARSAGLLAPSVIAPLMNSSFTWALSVLSGFLLAAAICVYLVEVETKGRALE